MGFPRSSVGKESAYSVGDLGSIPGWGIFPGEGNGNPLQYSSRKSHGQRSLVQATVHGVAKSRTRLSDFTSLHFSTVSEGRVSRLMWVTALSSFGKLVGDMGYKNGWVAWLTQWTWIWVNSGSWWWTGWPGVLRFMGSQRVGHDWATALNWTLRWSSEIAQEKLGWSRAKGSLRNFLVFFFTTGYKLKWVFQIG